MINPILDAWYDRLRKDRREAMKTQPKYSGTTKPKPAKKTHITKKEYQRTQAQAIDKNLDKFFAVKK
jgi:hypothetical protein